MFCDKADDSSDGDKPLPSPMATADQLCRNCTYEITGPTACPYCDMETAQVRSTGSNGMEATVQGRTLPSLMGVPAIKATVSTTTKASAIRAANALDLFSQLPPN